MKIKTAAFILFLICISMTACSVSEASSENRDEVFFDDGAKAEQVVASTDELVITDQDLGEQPGRNSSSSAILQSQTIIAADNSKITISGDRYGTKTESRCFQNHPRLDCVVVITAADGTKEAFVYPVGSGAKRLPDNLSPQALEAGADELANAVGATKTRSDAATGKESPYATKGANQNLTPLPSSAFPVFPKQMPRQLPPVTGQVEPTEPTEPAEENNQPADTPENLL